MKYLTEKHYRIILIISMIWIFIFLGLTAIMDDYFKLGLWWNLLLLPNYIFIGYQFIHLRKTIKDSKVVAK